MAKSKSVVIVGGGVIGLSCAWRLAQSGRTVTLLERSVCGSGASGVPFAALWPSAATKQGAGHLAHRDSLWRFEPFVRELETATGIEIEFGRPGRIELFRSADRRSTAAKEVSLACEHWPAFHEPVQTLLSDEEIRALEPELAPCPHGGLLCHASAYVDAQALVAALRSACIRLGVSLEENREAMDILVQDGRAAGTLTWEGPIRAEQVLIAAGAWTGELSPELKLAAPIEPLRGQILLLQPSRPVIRHLVKRGQTYLIPTASGRVLVGATTEADAGFDDSIKGRDREELLQAAASVAPALADAAIVGEWAGLRPQPADRSAKVEAVAGCQGLYVAAGHYKIGVAMAPHVSRQVATMLGETES